SKYKKLKTKLKDAKALKKKIMGESVGSTSSSEKKGTS
ncbi:unnamed protein product, partial [Ectocarpus sp. 8 AP-2014]